MSDRNRNTSSHRVAKTMDTSTRHKRRSRAKGAPASIRKIQNYDVSEAERDRLRLYQPSLLDSYSIAGTFNYGDSQPPPATNKSVLGEQSPSSPKSTMITGRSTTREVISTDSGIAAESPTHHEIYSNKWTSIVGTAQPMTLYGDARGQPEEDLNRERPSRDAQWKAEAMRELFGGCDFWESGGETSSQGRNEKLTSPQAPSHPTYSPTFSTTPGRYCVDVSGNIVFERASHVADRGFEDRGDGNIDH